MTNRLSKLGKSLISGSNSVSLKTAPPPKQVEVLNRLTDQVNQLSEGLKLIQDRLENKDVEISFKVPRRAKKVADKAATVEEVVNEAAEVIEAVSSVVSNSSDE